MSVSILNFSERQIAAAAEMLARAFHEDPLTVHAIPDPEERARLLPEVYARTVRFGALAGEVHATAGALEGIALWLPPNARWTRENIQASGLGELPMLMGDQAYQRYRQVVAREWQARERDMSGRCWYLFLLGVEPSRQRHGLGSALMHPVLERADNDRLPCYLETENQRNVAFYLEQGFDLIVSGEEVGTSGVRFWTFRRSPRRRKAAEPPASSEVQISST